LTYLFFQYRIIFIHPNLTSIIQKIYLFSFKGKVNMKVKKLVTLAVPFIPLYVVKLYKEGDGTVNYICEITNVSRSSLY